MSPLPLRKDQIEDLAAYISSPRIINASDPGTGKTPSVCVYIEYLFRHRGIKTIWAMPKSLITKNAHELLRFTNLREENIGYISTKKVLNPERIIVWLTTFAGFASHWQRLKTENPEIDAMIFDEWHMGGFRSPKSKRSLSLFDAAANLKVFLPMSGTMISGRLDSCYTAIKLVNPYYYGTHNQFLMEHALVDDYGNPYMWINHEKIGQIFLKHSIRRKFDEVFGKTKIVFQAEFAEMTGAQKIAYDEFEATALLELDDKFIDGLNSAVNVIRCRQIMAHPHQMGILNDNNELTGKEELLQIHVEDHINSGEPLLIYAALQPEQERITELCKKWGLKVGLINGNITALDRAKIDAKFRSGELNCVVASPATASIGFNWQHVNHVIFMSLGYDNVDFTQAYKRAIRGKREHSLRVTIMSYDNGVEFRIKQILDKKSRDLNKVDSSYEILTLSQLGEAPVVVEQQVQEEIPKTENISRKGKITLASI